MVKKGDRVKLTSTTDRYTNLQPGDEGIVQDISEFPAAIGGGRVVWVQWDKGNRLGLIEGEDQFSVLRGMDPHIDRRLNLECGFCEWFKKRFDEGKGTKADEAVYEHHLEVVHRLTASGVWNGKPKPHLKEIREKRLCRRR